ncbi:hypothetical protein ACTMTF_48380 [Nonomuraea sp. ZG12]|uniref:hypothetical protein n=1 Tax=Nonomuraea sp. ZG12 TaxID=3452207 RepID=UPI003F8CE085
MRPSRAGGAACSPSAPGRIAGRRPVRQPGAEGRALASSEEVADSEIIEHYPHGPYGCGADLARAADLG